MKTLSVKKIFIFLLSFLTLFVGIFSFSLSSVSASSTPSKADDLSSYTEFQAEVGVDLNNVWIKLDYSYDDVLDEADFFADISFSTWHLSLSQRSSYDVDDGEGTCCSFDYTDLQHFIDSDFIFIKLDLDYFSSISTAIEDMIVVSSSEILACYKAPVESEVEDVEKEVEKDNFVSFFNILTIVSSTAFLCLIVAFVVLLVQKNKRAYKKRR